MQLWKIDQFKIQWQKLPLRRVAVQAQRQSALEPLDSDVTDEVWRPSAEWFSLVWGRSTFCSTQAFNWLDEAHPHYKGKSALLKSTDLKCIPHPKKPSQKHPE